jgi:hypothetical protein
MSKKPEVVKITKSNIDGKRYKAQFQNKDGETVKTIHFASSDH